MAPVRSPRLPVLLLGVIFTLTLGVSRDAARAAPDAVALCRRIADPAQRLRCFDLAPADDVAVEDIVLRELECRRAPRTAEAIRSLVQGGYATPRPFRVVDSLNFFSLERPTKIDGLIVVAVFGYD